MHFRYGVDRDVFQPDARGSDREGARVRAYHKVHIPMRQVTVTSLSHVRRDAATFR